jgi:ferric-dicitrate binding protein FerR (iron transport regulator)
MGWLTRRETPRRIFEDGVRWVDAIKQRRADPEAFVCWALHSRSHAAAFAQAWRIWHDLRALTPEQREEIERLSSQPGSSGARRQ